MLTVVGDGSQRQALETLAAELNLKQTSFTGRVEHDEILGYYANADVFLNASRIDNQPLSILEAFACGLPVVTTNAGGIPDIVTDGETGFVVDIDDHQTLAQRAMQLLSNDNIAATMTRKAREECRKYTWEVVCDRWLCLYRKIVENNS